ncbi:MAG: Preprotein translocase subunit SecB, partial [Lachnospiraceae bacterium]|nr:Preprotein translocase subunit SecB [Lachnospiraceae bacterium]
MADGAKSVLNLDQIVFDRIEFQRLGFSSDDKFSYEIQADISQKQGEDVYRIALTMNGIKANEYSL